MIGDKYVKADEAEVTCGGMEQYYKYHAVRVCCTVSIGYSTVRSVDDESGSVPSHDDDRFVQHQPRQSVSS